MKNNAASFADLAVPIVCGSVGYPTFESPSSTKYVTKDVAADCSESNWVEA